MRAARLHGHRDIRIDEVPLVPCGDQEIAITPRFNGICGSDLHLYFDEPMTAALAQPHPVSGESLPLTLGHEFSGVITQLGKDVTRFQVGDKVTVQPVINDGSCSACRSGAINCCRRLGFQGIHGRGGGLSDSVIAPEHSVFRLPDSVSLEVGALIEPLAVGWHAVRIAGECSASTSALVHGSGPIGCAVILALRAKGVRQIIVSEVSEPRSILATKFGASKVVNPKEVDLVQVVRDATDEEGVELVFDCAGVPSSFLTGFAALRSKGTFVNLALWSQPPPPLDLYSMVIKELTYKGSIAYTPQDYEEVIKALEFGNMEPEHMITQKIALHDLVQEGIEALHRNTGENCKILVDLSL